MAGGVKVCAGWLASEVSTSSPGSNRSSPVVVMVEGERRAGVTGLVCSVSVQPLGVSAPMGLRRAPQ